MTPGHFDADMPEDQYHRHPALSTTGIKGLLRCPARFRHDRDHGRAPKDSFDLGSAAHTMVLGTGWELAEWTGEDWRGKEAGEFKAAARAAGKIPILASQMHEVRKMHTRLLDHPAGRYFSSGGISEVSMFWADEETGVECRARADRLTVEDDRPLIIDYKTCSDASIHGVRSSVAKYGYNIQQAFYTWGLIESGLDPDAVGSFLFIFQETSAPYPVTMVRLADTAVWLGRQDVRRALELYARCARDDHWPDYADDVTEIDLPRWKYYEL